MSFLSRTLPRTLAVASIAMLAALWAGCAGDYPQSTFSPVTELGVRINELFASLFWWTMLVLVIVFVLLVYILIRFRSRPGVEPKKFYGNNLAEIGWTLGPAMIVVILLVPTVRTIFYTYEEPPEDALVVEAVGHQWWWEFRYPQLGIITANEMHLPVGRPVDIRLSSADVIHNWWVPRLGGKRYNYPVAARPQGAPEPKNYERISFTVNEPGQYSGQCAEFCGESHALMRMMVVAESPEEFDAWVQGMKAPANAVPAAGTLEEQGYNAFLRVGCTACHAVAGTPAMGRLGPDLTGIGSRWKIGAGLLPNTAEHLAKWIRNSAEVKPGSKMLAFPNITDEDMTAIIAYLQSLR
mgnify:CR=1 FL=1|jgi:cytochrome c oxidase subunit 2